jgi:ATP-dependent DNA helicase DinG
MAAAVARTVAQGGVLVAEAATGVGKTFAYLVPALLSGERVLLSTATKALQDQLHGRDLPLLTQALGVPVRTALLKGAAATCACTAWIWQAKAPIRPACTCAMHYRK